MKTLLLCLSLFILAFACERKVSTMPEHDQSGDTAASRMGSGDQGTAPRPTEGTGEAPPIATATATNTE